LTIVVAERGEEVPLLVPLFGKEGQGEICGAMGGLILQRISETGH
jgi:hypothetical protein